MNELRNRVNINHIHFKLHFGFIFLQLTLSLIVCQMILVISSPSISTTGCLTLIFLNEAMLRICAKVASRYGVGVAKRDAVWKRRAEEGRKEFMPVNRTKKFQPATGIDKNGARVGWGAGDG